MAFALAPDNLTFANLEVIFREGPLLELPPLAGVPVTPTPEKSELAQAYLTTHVVSFGPAVSEEVIRLALVLQLYNFIQDNSQTINPAVIQRVLAFYNREVFPVVQQQGSAVSEAAQLCLPLLGNGKVNFQGYELNAADVNDIFSWEPLTLFPAEVDYLVNLPIFTYAESTINLIKLQPLLPWLNYLLTFFRQLAPTEEPLSAETEKLTATVEEVQNLIAENAILPAEKQNLGLLRDSLLVLLTEINYVNGALADYTTETLENLFASAEPPATTGYTLASALVQSLQKQLALVAPNPTDMVFTRANINIINQLLTKAIIYIEQLVALAFWSVAQVGKVFNVTAGNLTLSTYYHSPLFVPKEMVSDQLEKTITFIRSTSPNPVT